MKIFSSIQILQLYFQPQVQFLRQYSTSTHYKQSFSWWLLELGSLEGLTNPDTMRFLNYLNVFQAVALTHFPWPFTVIKPLAFLR